MIQFDAFGQRDHSCGPRHNGHMHRESWVNGTFPDGTIFHCVQVFCTARRPTSWGICGRVPNFCRSRIIAARCSPGLWVSQGISRSALLARERARKSPANCWGPTPDTDAPGHVSRSAAGPGRSGVRRAWAMGVERPSRLRLGRTRLHQRWMAVNQNSRCSACVRYSPRGIISPVGKGAGHKKLAPLSFTLQRAIRPFPRHPTAAIAAPVCAISIQKIDIVPVVIGRWFELSAVRCFETVGVAKAGPCAAVCASGLRTWNCMRYLRHFLLRKHKVAATCIVSATSSALASPASSPPRG